MYEAAGSRQFPQRATHFALATDSEPCVELDADVKGIAFVHPRCGRVWNGFSRVSVNRLAGAAGLRDGDVVVKNVSRTDIHLVALVPRTAGSLSP